MSLYMYNKIVGAIHQLCQNQIQIVDSRNK